MQVEQSIKVRILGREYPLRVGEEDAQTTKAIASYLNDRIQAFRDAHPDQPELTSAVIAALTITEELFNLRDRHLKATGEIDDEVGNLNALLREVLDD